MKISPNQRLLQLSRGLFLVLLSLAFLSSSNTAYSSHYSKLSKQELKPIHAERISRFQNWEPKVYIRASSNPREFNLNPAPLPKSIQKKIKKSSIFTLLYFDGENVKYDYKQASISEDLPIYGWSMSKSIISYLLGKAYCDGRIDSLTDPIGKYAASLKGTFYENVRIIDALNMASGDKKLYPGAKDRSKMWKYYVLPVAMEKVSIKDALLKLGNPPPSKKKFDYRNPNTDVIATVITAVASEGISEFISTNLADAAGFKYPSYFLADSDGVPIGFLYFIAARTDWLRAAIKIGEDYRVEGCIGEYLRSAITETVKTYNDINNDHVRYGKFFWSKGVLSKFPHLAMKGHGGIRGVIGTDGPSVQVIMIHAIRDDYKEKNLLKSVLK